jgi:multidrug resistance protein MdtO
MNDTIDYEFGVDRQLHAHAGQTVLHAALTMVAFFWNQFVVLHNERDSDFHTEPSLQHLRSVLADRMDTMAKAVVYNTEFVLIHPEDLIAHSMLVHQRYGEYVQNSIARFDELQRIVAQLGTQPVP